MKSVVHSYVEYTSMFEFLLLSLALHEKKRRLTPSCAKWIAELDQ